MRREKKRWDMTDEKRWETRKWTKRWKQQNERWLAIKEEHTMEKQNNTEDVDRRSYNRKMRTEEVEIRDERETWMQIQKRQIDRWWGKQRWYKMTLRWRRKRITLSCCYSSIYLKRHHPHTPPAFILHTLTHTPVSYTSMQQIQLQIKLPTRFNLRHIN